MMFSSIVVTCSLDDSVFILFLSRPNHGAPCPWEDRYQTEQLTVES